MFTATDDTKQEQREENTRKTLKAKRTNEYYHDLRHTHSRKTGILKKIKKYTMSFLQDGPLLVAYVEELV